MLVGSCSDCARRNEGIGGFCEKCYHRDYFTPSKEFIEANKDWYAKQNNVVGLPPSERKDPSQEMVR